MPSIAQAPPSPLLAGRKRRRDFEEYGLGAEMEKSGEMQMQMKIAASPHKSQHQTTTLFHANQIISDHAHAHKIPRPHAQHKRPRPNVSCNAQNTLEDDKENGINYETKQEPQSLDFGEKRVTAKIDLSPCHICHRKPSELRHLDDYADCEACGRRTCFVCIRQCEGLGMERGEGYLGGEEGFDLTLSWHGDEMCVERARKEDGADVGLEKKVLGGGTWEMERRKEHRGKVCSRCCVERGPEGEVWCLGCLRAVDGD